MPSDSENHSKMRLIPEGIGMFQLRGVKKMEQDDARMKCPLKKVKRVIL